MSKFKSMDFSYLFGNNLNKYQFSTSNPDLPVYFQKFCAHISNILTTFPTLLFWIFLKKNLIQDNVWVNKKKIELTACFRGQELSEKLYGICREKIMAHSVKLHDCFLFHFIFRNITDHFQETSSQTCFDALWSVFQKS